MESNRGRGQGSLWTVEPTEEDEEEEGGGEEEEGFRCSMESTSMFTNRYYGIIKVFSVLCTIFYGVNGWSNFYFSNNL
jgi:hypothetical protein